MLIDIRTLALAVGILSLAGPAQARTWIIQSDGTGDAPTIQAGIDSSATADTVLLANGTFSGPGNRDIRFNGKEITVTSMNGPAMSIVDCEGMHRGFSLSTGETPNSVLSGITIANGARERGAGIAIGMGSPTVIGNVVQDCVASIQGGGIRITSGTASPLIRDNQILRCSVTGGGSGGGIDINGSSPTLENNTIANNQAEHGGGIYVAGMNPAPIIIDNVISGNTAVGEGGGIRVAPLSAMTLSGNLVVSNQAASGGGIYFEGTGGAAVIERNTVTENSAAAGAGVYFQTASATLLRSIVAFNLGAAGIECNGSGHVVSCSIVHGNAGGDAICGGDGSNNQKDPLFCDAGTGDYGLAENSPGAPTNSSCGELIGARAVGCAATPVLHETWGKIKSLYRR